MSARMLRSETELSMKTAETVRSGKSTNSPALRYNPTSNLIFPELSYIKAISNTEIGKSIAVTKIALSDGTLEKFLF